MFTAGECPNCDEYRAANPDPLAELRLAVAGQHDEIAAHRSELATLLGLVGEQAARLAALKGRVALLESLRRADLVARLPATNLDEEAMIARVVAACAPTPAPCPALEPLGDGWNGLDVPAWGAAVLGSESERRVPRPQPRDGAEPGAGWRDASRTSEPQT